jgi:hypothetical protein
VGMLVCGPDDKRAGQVAEVVGGAYDRLDPSRRSRLLGLGSAIQMGALRGVLKIFPPETLPAVRVRLGVRITLIEASGHSVK